MIDPDNTPASTIPVCSVVDGSSTQVICFLVGQVIPEYNHLLLDEVTCVAREIF